MPFENDYSVMAKVTADPTKAVFEDCTKIYFRAAVSRGSKGLMFTVEYRTTPDRAEKLLKSLAKGAEVQVKGELWNETVGEGDAIKRYLKLAARDLQLIKSDAPVADKTDPRIDARKEMTSFFGATLPN